APLMVAGLYAGHALGYRLAIPDAHARAHALANSGHSYFGYLPLTLTVCLGILIAALALRALAAFRGEPSRPAASPAMILLPPLAFVVQEYVERIAYTGHVSWTVAFEPSFLLGLACQLPFALAALLIAWALDSAAHAVGRALASGLARGLVPALVPVPVRTSAIRRPVGLARGYGERAPPSFRRP